MAEVEVDLPEDVLLFCALEAHKKNQTLNNYFNDLLVKKLDETFVDTVERLANVVEDVLFCEGDYHNELKRAWQHLVEAYGVRYGEKGHRGDYGLTDLSKEPSEDAPKG